MNLPPKPEAVAHVPNSQWEASLDKAMRLSGLGSNIGCWQSFRNDTIAGLADHARCLILLGEVPEPVDPIEAAIDAAWNEYLANQSGRGIKSASENFSAACRKHFSGLTFPKEGATS